MPYQAKPCPYGHGLVATTFIPVGPIIDHFAGYETAYQPLPDAFKCLIIYLDQNRAFVIPNDLVYANHRCAYNCRIEDDALVALRTIQLDEQLTFSYNIFPMERLNVADDLTPRMKAL